MPGGFAEIVPGRPVGCAGCVQGGRREGSHGVAKKADTLDVASAINNAELTLQSVVAVRDRVIQAYQEAHPHADRAMNG